MEISGALSAANVGTAIPRHIKNARAKEKTRFFIFYQSSFICLFQGGQVIIDLYKAIITVLYLQGNSFINYM